MLAEHLEIFDRLLDGDRSRASKTLERHLQAFGRDQCQASGRAGKLPKSRRIPFLIPADGPDRPLHPPVERLPAPRGGEPFGAVRPGRRDPRSAVRALAGFSYFLTSGQAESASLPNASSPFIVLRILIEVPSPFDSAGVLT